MERLNGVTQGQKMNLITLDFETYYDDHAKLDRIKSFLIKHQLNF